MTLPPTWNLFGDDHLPHRILLLAKMIDREAARQLLDDFGLSLAEWRVLAFVCSAGPATAADVGSAFEVDRAEVSRAVGRLIDGGYVDRATLPSNRKKMILHPTKEGRAIFDDARKVRQRYFQAIMQDLDPPTTSLMADMLEKVALRVVELR
ncbi:MAG: MarR family transcriptional regulator [Sphingobium sp.]